MEESDLDLMLRVLDKWKVQYQLVDEFGGRAIRLRAKTQFVEGYFDFFVDIDFNADDTFNSFGIWE